MSTKASAQIVIGSYFVPRVLVQLQVFMQAQRRKKISIKRGPPIDMVTRSGRSAYNAILEKTIMDHPRLHSNLYITSLSRLSGAIPNLQRKSSTVQPEKGNNPDTVHSIRTPAKLAHHGASAISSHRTTPTAKTLVHLAPVIPRAQSTAEIRLPVSQEGVTTGRPGGNFETRRSRPITSAVHRGSTAGCRSQIATEKKQLSADSVDLAKEESERAEETAGRRHGRTCS
ncbi:hypothetical protein ATETN484_0008003300 [Aspergillus terreus]|nr:hypothetical protein ATETN484_0008003300 [Aspergillus terreus]